MKILVIRRDNIGDLVCTTPMLSSLRRHFPDAHLAVLVNSYNAPVLAGNPDVDEVCIYRKAKHRMAGQTRLAVWWATWRLLRRLRQTRFDVVFVATPGKQPAALRFARWVAGRRGRIVADGDAADGIGDPLNRIAPVGAGTGILRKMMKNPGGLADEAATKHKRCCVCSKRSLSSSLRVQRGYTLTQNGLPE